MENFNHELPIISERNQYEQNNSGERQRDLLSNEIDYTAELLQEFSIPDYEHMTNKSFQVYDKKYNRGSFDCRYEHGEMQDATIDLIARNGNLDASLTYDQSRDAWQMHSHEHDETRLVSNLEIVRSMIPPKLQTEQMREASHTDVTFDDLVQVFARSTEGFVDKKTYISLGIDSDNLSVESMSETAVKLEVSTSLNPEKNYNSLHAIHRTTDFPENAEPSSHIDREYKIATGKRNISYLEKGMSAKDAGEILANLKDEKNFTNL